MIDAQVEENDESRETMDKGEVQGSQVSQALREILRGCCVSANAHLRQTEQETVSAAGLAHMDSVNGLRMYKKDASVVLMSYRF